MTKTFEERTEALEQWFLAIPGAFMSSKIKIADLRAQQLGRGVVALEDIDEGEELFKIPLSSVLTYYGSDLHQTAPHVFSDLDPWLTPILVLIHEVLKRENSFWKCYFDILPDKFDMPMFWTFEELEELQASPLRNRIGRQTTDQAFQEILVPLIRRHQDIFFKDTIHEVSNSDLMALAHRMGASMMSYGFAVDRENIEVNASEDSFYEEESSLNNSLVPMADMLNAQANNNARLSQEHPDALTMETIRPIKKGEEILNDYGPLPRSELLRSYGYLHSSYSQYDVVELSQDALVEACGTYRRLGKDELDARLKWLVDRDQLEDAYLILSRERTGSCFTDDIWVILLTLLADTNEYKRAANLGSSITILHSNARKALDTALRSKLEQYKTSIAEDSMLLEKASVDGRLRQAIVVRLGEKQILADAIQEIKEALLQEMDTVNNPDYHLQSTRKKPKA